MANPNTQTLAGHPVENKTFYDRELLERLLPQLVYFQYGQKRSAPRKEGDTINFRRFNSLPPALTPLTEGVTPDGRALDISAITATVKQYGDYVTISDLIDLMGIDPILTETVGLLGEQAGLTLDLIVRDIVAAGTNVYYVGGHVDRGQITASDVLTGGTLRQIRRIMARNNVKPVSGAGAYIGFIHPDAIHDIQSDAGHGNWLEVTKYTTPERAFNGEVGKLYGIRMIETTLAPIYEGEGAGGADVYATIVIGANAYGVVDIAGSSKPETIIKPHGSAGTADPLDQRATAGWKALFTAVRLQELAILRVEHTVSAA